MKFFNTIALLAATTGAVQLGKVAASKKFQEKAATEEEGVHLDTFKELEDACELKREAPHGQETIDACRKAWEFAQKKLPSEEVESDCASTSSWRIVKWFKETGCSAKKKVSYSTKRRSMFKAHNKAILREANENRQLVWQWLSLAPGSEKTEQLRALLAKQSLEDDQRVPNSEVQARVGHTVKEFRNFEDAVDGEITPQEQEQFLTASDAPLEYARKKCLGIEAAAPAVKTTTTTIAPVQEDVSHESVVNEDVSSGLSSMEEVDFLQLRAGAGVDPAACTLGRGFIELVVNAECERLTNRCWEMPEREHWYQTDEAEGCMETFDTCRKLLMAPVRKYHEWFDAHALPYPESIEE